METLETIYKKPKQKKVRFYFVTLKWHGSTCYVNWAILIGDPADVTTLLLVSVLGLYSCLKLSIIAIYRISATTFTTSGLGLQLKNF